MYLRKSCLHKVESTTTLYRPCIPTSVAPDGKATFLCIAISFIRWRYLFMWLSVTEIIWQISSWQMIRRRKWKSNNVFLSWARIPSKQRRGLFFLNSSETRGIITTDRRLRAGTRSKGESRWKPTRLHAEPHSDSVAWRYHPRRFRDRYAHIHKVPCAGIIGEEMFSQCKKQSSGTRFTRARKQTHIIRWTLKGRCPYRDYVRKEGT